jgi:hypothetical protein
MSAKTKNIVAPIISPNKEAANSLTGSLDIMIRTLPCMVNFAYSKVEKIILHLKMHLRIMGESKRTSSYWNLYS